jgi:gluconate 2-dehydrogenase alpha chain
VILAAYALNNVRLLLMSQMGRPYDPLTGAGVVGKNYTFHYGTRSVGFFRNRAFKRFMGAGAAGFAIDDFNSDNFDHTGLGFVGGSNILCVAGGSGPVTDLVVPPQTPNWGRQWQDAIRIWYDRTVSIVTVGDVLPHRMNFLDLDPTYRDAWGDPLLRITFDWRENERKIVRFVADQVRKILAEMQPDQAIISDSLAPQFDTAPYQSTHNGGGAIMGCDSDTSVVNSYLQMWDFPNVWVVGGSALPQNPGHGPTGTIGALAYRVTDGILNRYIGRPGPLV